MKFAAATTLLFATLALANPGNWAPISQPEADAAPVKVDTRDALTEALVAREPEEAAPALAPELEARAAGIRLDSRDDLESRDPKKPKAPKNSNNNDTDSGVAGMVSPSRVLELGAVGLGVMEIVRLWG